jgi:hypothetical protein
MIPLVLPYLGAERVCCGGQGLAGEMFLVRHGRTAGKVLYWRFNRGRGSRLGQT